MAASRRRSTPGVGVSPLGAWFVRQPGSFVSQKCPCLREQDLPDLLKPGGRQPWVQIFIDNWMETQVVKIRPHQAICVNAGDVE